MIKTMFCAAALGLTLGGCMAPSQPVATLAAATATSTEAFAPMAASANLLEIETSRLALERSRDPQIRRLANEMIRDHTRASRRMDSVARAAGVQPPPPTLSARHQAIVDRLAATPGSDFDAAYLTVQADAHAEAVTLFRSYASNGDNPRLVAFARETLPTLERHAAHVQRVARS